ncbi:MAG: hypothetical protein ACSLFJ_10225 [Immundisolibacter sp.]|uniref:hypothetical protein n=1 Tax=Immundisolibacter sp. TaxID=1934948 RepID=UPI003EDF2888
MPDLTRPPGLDNPTLTLAQAAVCLHYVEGPIEEPTESMPGHAYSDNSPFASMELDLLAYRFQDPAPFGSDTGTVPKAEAPQRRPIMIEYPESFKFHSEGRVETLDVSEPLRRAELLVSSTHFAACGRRIWHLVITPREGETFSEYDLIMLIHLYDGRTERTGLNETIRFRLGDQDSAGCLVTELPRRLGLPLHSSCDPELKCGTLQLLTGDGGAATGIDNPQPNVFDTLRGAREPDGDADARELKAWMRKDCRERRDIMAYCGIVTGIFDFAKIDDEEALDTLEPTFASSSAFLRIHRRTLISIADDDRSMIECWNSIGISPYLILPHAALIYNETLVDWAERGIDKALVDHEARLGVLEDAYFNADRHLNTLYLPNVFNYVTERSLFEAGSECRGSTARRSAVLAKLNHLKSQIDIVREHQHKGGEMIIQLLLAVISLLQIKNVIDEILGGEDLNSGVWIALILGILIIACVFWWSYRRGLPRRTR